MVNYSKPIVASDGSKAKFNWKSKIAPRGRYRDYVHNVSIFRPKDPRAGQGGWRGFFANSNGRLYNKYHEELPTIENVQVFKTEEDVLDPNQWDEGAPVKLEDGRVAFFKHADLNYTGGFWIYLRVQPFKYAPFFWSTRRFGSRGESQYPYIADIDTSELEITTKYEIRKQSFEAANPGKEYNDQYERMK